ncbi:Nn.00g093510.m01.CDS01 [Neocucurbitaria sp. VM-36]
MAYRDQPEPHQAPYSPSYDGNYESRTYYDRDSQYQIPTNGRSRESSTAASDGHHQPIQQPLKNAIGNAFDKSDAARVVDPDLIAQITAEVKRSVLDEIKMGVMAGATQPQPVPVSPQHYVPPSPASTSASFPPRDVYTPPSPKHTDFQSQPPPTANPSLRDPVLDGNDDTPTPRYERSAPIDVPQERSTARPNPAARMATDDYTPIEKMWQRLFEPEGQPLPRLGEFLRGLALHLIEDYEPKKSLVISPAKMLKFYEEVKIQDEIYPWQTIFGKLSYSSLSKIYRDMRCQHHLIQEHPAEQPYIPALTPDGFQEWMTAMIQAYPDAEYERVAKAVLDMPISNADDRKERFPKELPRRMFPTAENLQAQQRCAAALSAEGVGPLRKAPTFPPPPPKSQPIPVPNLERERNPYASQPDARPSESEDEMESTSVPIERQRNPYASTPGAGKTYDNDLNQSTYPGAAMNEQRRRAQSTTSQGPWAPPPPDTYQTRAGPTANTRRPRSPSFSNYGTQSDPAFRDIPSSYYASNLHDLDDDTRRYSKDADGKRHDRHRRSTAGTDGSFDSQPRSVYDDDDYRGRGGSNGYENRGYEPRRY